MLRITHAKVPQKFTYTLNNTELQETQTYTYLGVDLSHGLTWNSHIKRITTKANSGFPEEKHISMPHSYQGHGIQNPCASNFGILLICVGSPYINSHQAIRINTEPGSEICERSVQQKKQYDSNQTRTVLGISATLEKSRHTDQFPTSSRG